MTKTDEVITNLEKLSERLTKCHRLEHDGAITEEEVQAVDEAAMILTAIQREFKAGMKDVL